MRIAILALFGLFSFTIVCPITMAAMPMDMGDMQMSHMMPSDDEGNGSMPCEQCEKEKEEIVASFSSQTEVVFSSSIPVSILAYWNLSEQVSLANSHLSLFANGPPLPAETLVGTVILRT